jgi:hypothetical protein
MAGRPIVVHVFKSYEEEGNPDHGEEKGMDLFLTRHYGCDVRIFSGVERFMKSATRYRILSDADALACLCVECPILETNEDALKMVSFIRCFVSRTAPIVFFRDKSSITSFQELNVYLFDYCNQDAIVLFERLMKGWISRDWLGAETEEEERLLVRRLEYAHRMHSLEEGV